MNTTTTSTNGRAAAAPPDLRPDTTDAVIETRGLTKVYPGDVRAVDDLDLVVRRGEIFGLLGPNGAGKTTTAGMLTTRVLPTSGTALVGGIDVVARPTEAKRLIGVVPQTNTLDRSLTVWENLYFHGRFFGMDTKTAKSEATRLLGQFRLADRADALVLALSGGMAQRLMVARAVMHRPSILFLDEPTAGLDPQSRIALWEILGELHVDGQTILLTTHYMEEADQLCDRVAIIDQGRIVALDTPRGLKRSTGADTTVKVSSDGDLDALGALLRTEIAGSTDAKVVGGAVLLGVQDATGVVPTVVQVAERHGFVVTDLSVSETTLETVFISLTGKDLRGMTAIATPMGTTVSYAPGPLPALRTTKGSAFGALLLRDLTVLRKNLKEFIPRTVLQPLLLVFVFTYVFPKIGQGVGGAGAAAALFSSVLVAGVIGTAILFQGIQSTALPLVQEFGYTREIEDRVLAPLPVGLVAFEKVVAGALQCAIAAIIVFPIAAVVPATPVHLHINWLILLTLGPLACLMSAAAGLMFGTMFDPRTIPMLFGVIVIPITFLGCTYYSWRALEPVRWLQIATLVNPLVYLSEGFRAALTPVPHMSLLAVYPVVIGFAALFTWLGIRGFTKRVIA